MHLVCYMDLDAVRYNRAIPEDVVHQVLVRLVGTARDRGKMGKSLCVAAVEEEAADDVDAQCSRVVVVVGCGGEGAPAGCGEDDAA